MGRMCVALFFSSQKIGVLNRNAHEAEGDFAEVQAQQQHQQQQQEQVHDKPTTSVHSNDGMHTQPCCHCRTMPRMGHLLHQRFINSVPRTHPTCMLLVAATSEAEQHQYTCRKTCQLTMGTPTCHVDQFT